MTMLRERPRTDISMLPAWSGGVQTTHMRRWGDQMGQGQSELITPSTLNPGRNFNPTNVLLYGRRGRGKTLTVTGLLKLFTMRFLDPSLGRWAGVRRCMANYWVRPVFDAGPVGTYAGFLEDENGDDHYGLIPVDPCAADIPYRLGSMPSWGMHRLTGIDEFADVLPSGTISRETRDFGSTMRQQRSLRSEFLGATQYPQDIQRSLILKQIDLLGLVKPHFSSWSVDILLFDIHGQFTGNWGKHRFLPPMEQDYDWSIGVGGLDTVRHDYNTFQLVAHAGRKDRDFINERQWRDLPTYAKFGSPFFKEIPMPGEPQGGDSVLVPVLDVPDRMLDELEQLRMPMEYEDVRAALRNAGVMSRSMGHIALRDWLEERGYKVYKDAYTGNQTVNRSG